MYGRALHQKAIVMPQTATARAHANLAFVKYWGKADASINLPLNNSISMNLNQATTITTVTFDDRLTADQVVVGDAPASAAFATRVSKHLDRVRDLAGNRSHAHVHTVNTFPAGAGIASSASGLAALSLAASAALGLKLDERELSILARRGSGSACRSIPAGFVEWYAGQANDDSYASSIAAPEHWAICDLAVIISRAAKKIPSSEGHELARGSIFSQVRLDQLPARTEVIRRAILERDFATFGRETEAEALAMHAIAMTSAYTAGNAWHSGVYYWLPETLELLIAVQEWREQGLPVYFTLDAGPTVHLLCPAEAADQVLAAVHATAAERPGRAWEVLRNDPGGPAVLIEP